MLQYEPELFPGLIYRMVHPKIVLLIFVSGKVVLTGGKVHVQLPALLYRVRRVPLCHEITPVGHNDPSTAFPTSIIGS